MSEVGRIRVHSVLERLKGLASELSGYEAAELDVTSTFLDMGFDSLFLTQLATTFQREYGLKITFRQLFDELPTLRALAEYIDGKLPPEAVPAANPATVAAPATPQRIEPAAQSSVPAPSVSVAAAPTVETAEAQGARGNGEIVGSTMQQVMARQLELMAKQLSVLRAFNTPSSGVADAVTAMASDGASSGRQSPSNVVTVGQAAPSASTAPAAAGEPTERPKGFGPIVKRESMTLTLRQRHHIDRLTARYNARTMGSKLHTQRHRPHHADPRTAAGFNRLWKEMVYPIVIERSQGCRLQDVDGNSYIDILNGFGPNFLGHSPPFVSEALKTQIEKGIEVGPQTPLAGEAARLLAEITGMDRVSWVNTGSEAVQAAIRLSRTYTGRSKIVVFSGDYHGNFDEVLVRATKTGAGRRTLPLAPGIPFGAVEQVLVLDYGTDESLAVIQAQADEIAAVLVEPVQSRRPEFQPREFLHALRALTERAGIVLIFDEVITGFRICPGGAQEYFGVQADLATYGKIIGGGMPIGVVAGRARFMDTFDGGQWGYGDDTFPAAGVTFFAGTFVRHPLAIAAVHATLQYLKAQGPSLQEGVNRRTTRLANELNAFFAQRGVKIHIAHFASQMFIRVQEAGELATLLFYHLRDRGIHVLENFPSYLTAAHSDEDVEGIIAAVKDSVLEMQADDILPRADSAVADTVPWRRCVPLSEGQSEVWLASQMSEMASCAFNESDSVLIRGALDVALFTKAVVKVLEEQEAFHYRFDRDGAMQWVDPDARFELASLDWSALDGPKRDRKLDALVEQQASTPFDLENGPVLRAHLVTLEPDRFVFMIYCHHLVFDGYSSQIVMRKIADAYRALHEGTVCESAATTPYSVYVYRALHAGAEPQLTQSLEYWRHVLGDNLPAPLDIPTDRPRGRIRSYRGATAHRALDPGLSSALRATAKALKTSMHGLLLGCFAALLSRLSGEEDMVLGIPVAGQARNNLDVVGYCVELLPIRSQPAAEKPFSTFVHEIQRHLLDALDHQGVSLSTIVRALDIPRDASRLPLIEVIFNYSSYFSDLQLPGCEVSTRENPRRAVYFDMFFNIIESDGRLVIDWDYNRDLFDPETIARWTEHFGELLSGIVNASGQAIGDLPLVAAGSEASASTMWGRT